MDRANIDKIAKTPDDRFFLAKCWDKIQAGIRKNIPAATAFLSPREQDMVRFLFGEYPGLILFGGYDDAERKCLVYLPEYLEESSLYEEDGPVACIRASFYHGDSPSHRDFLGALMGEGITRESLGDICIADTSCDFFTTGDIAPYILQNFTNAGRVHLQLEKIPLSDVVIPEPQIKEIRDTVASLRLDSVISSGFRISRGLAAEYIAAGKVSIDGMPCEKADKFATEGAKLSVRGAGKIKLAQVGAETKKGRISILIHRYI